MLTGHPSLRRKNWLWWKTTVKQMFISNQLSAGLRRDGVGIMTTDRVLQRSRTVPVYKEERQKKKKKKKTGQK